MTKHLACQDKKKENWAILIAYNITFYHVDSNHKCPLESNRGVNGATQSAIWDLGGLSSLSGVWGGAPVVNGFWKIFEQMELRFHQLLTRSERLHKILKNVMM